MRKSGAWNFFGAVLAIVAGLFLIGSSFARAREMRQIERTPRSDVVAVVPGEVNLSGVVLAHAESLTSPRTHSPCVYYRYLIEEERRDSDGDTYWATVSDTTDYVDFTLQDDTGSIVVRPDEFVDFRVDLSAFDQSGSRRYSEFRLDPGRFVFAFGYASGSVDDGFFVGFRAPGNYRPILSSADEGAARKALITNSVLKCWGAVSALTFAVVFLLAGTRRHRITSFLVAAAVTAATVLGGTGLTMLAGDLRAAAERLEEHRATVHQEFAAAMHVVGLTFDDDWEAVPSLDDLVFSGLPDPQRARLMRLRVDLARASERLRMQRRRFPDRVLAPLIGVGRPPPIPLPDAEVALMQGAEAAFSSSRLEGTGWAILMALAALIAALFTRYGLRRVRVKRCIENVPTAPVAGVVFGLTEVKGQIRPLDDNTLKGPLSGEKCVQYHYKISERRGSGKNARWVVVHNETLAVPFLCRDESGAIRIDPEGAEIVTTHAQTNRKGNRRHYETRLSPKDELYVLGPALIDGDSHASLAIGAPKKEDEIPFILANISENRLMMKKAIGGFWLLAIAMSLSTLIGLWLFGRAGSFAPTDYIAASMIAPLYLCLCVAVLMHNDLVFLRRRVTRGWANIDVSLAKRATLVPNLNRVLAAYMEHERDLQAWVTTLRSLPSGADAPHQAAHLVDVERKLVARMIALREDHPDLAAEPLAAKLFDTLVGLENEIALMREGYNQAVERYNTRCATIPESLIARLRRFEPAAHFAATEDEARGPELAFGPS